MIIAETLLMSTERAASSSSRTSLKCGGGLVDVLLSLVGVCLGLQGIVTTLGGSVDRVRPAHGEVATVEHDGAGVFAGLPSPFRAVRYHSLAAVRLPPGLTVTATDADGTVMGVRHLTRPLEGVQFHPESVLSEHGRQLVATFVGDLGGADG